MSISRGSCEEKAGYVEVYRSGLSARRGRMASERSVGGCAWHLIGRWIWSARGDW